MDYDCLFAIKQLMAHIISSWSQICSRGEKGTWLDGWMQSTIAVKDKQSRELKVCLEHYGPRVCLSFNMHNSRRQTPDTRSMWSQQDTLRPCVSVCGGQEEEEEREVKSLSSSYLSDELITRATVHWDAFVCTITQP